MSRRPSVLSVKFLGSVALCAIAMVAVVGDYSSATGATQEPRTMRAAAVVNDIIISTFDLEQRVKLVMVTSNAQGADAAKRLRPQVLRQLIDELLQLQEAQKANVKITTDELDKNFKRIAQQNQTSTDSINKMLDDNGIARTTLQNQLKADLAWQKLVQGRLAPRVSVSEDEIETAYKQAMAAASQTQYLVSEIFVAVDVPEAEEQAKQNIQSILGHLRGGATFSAIARQFSQSASATNGGDIGWVTEGDVAPALGTALKKMSPGAISEPVRSAGGYYILGVREKKLPKGSAVAAVDTQPQRPQAAQKMKGVITLGKVSIPLSEGASKAKQEAAKTTAIELYRSINGCGTAGAVAKSRGAKFETLGSITVRDMAPQFIKILEQTPNGRSTPPLRGAAGVELFVVCAGGMVPAAGVGGGGPGQTTTASKEVTREDIENRLFNQELAMLARRYLRDLRRDATIEMRDN